MHRNLFWQAFLCFVALCTLWYTAKAAYYYYHYSHLNASTQSEKIIWIVEEKNSDAFFLTANYSFSKDSTAYQGSTPFDKDLFLNRYAAETGLKEKGHHPQTVYYDSQDPLYSSLQKDFPFKECLSAIVLWGILVYFLWIGYYVSYRSS